MNYEFRDNTYFADLESDPKRRFQIEVGDSQQSTFIPQLKLLRWDNEVNFSLRFLVDDIPGVQSQTLSNGVIEYRKGQYKARFYEKPNGLYEFEIEIPKKPPTNTVTFSISTKGLKFFYQPPLTPEQIAEGDTQPDNAAGSYAVYHQSKGGMNVAGGMDYRTGKAFHIYRPHVTDKNGNETWGSIHIDEQAQTLTITVDQAWLNAAAYPIIVDPTFGNEDNNTAASSWSIDRKCASAGTPATSGTLTKLTARIGLTNTGSCKVRGVVYADNGGSPTGGALLATGDEVTLTDVGETIVDLPFSGANQLALVGSTTYWIGYHNEDPGTIFFSQSRGSTGAAQERENDTYSDGPTNPWAGTSEADGPIDCWGTYTEGGGASPEAFPTGRMTPNLFWGI